MHLKIYLTFIYLLLPQVGVVLKETTIAGMEERIVDHVAIWEPKIKVLEVYFIFSASLITSLEFTPQGMRNAAFVRYFRGKDGLLVELDEDAILEPFPSIGPGTHSQTVFGFLARIQFSSIKALSSKRIFQYTSKTLILEAVTRPCWEYLVRRFRFLLLESVPLLSLGVGNKSKRERKVLTPQLSVGLAKSTYTHAYIRGLMEPEMQASRSIFGTTFAIGTINSAPSKAARSAKPPQQFTMLRYDDNLWTVIVVSKVS